MPEPKSPMERRGVTNARWSAYCVHPFTIWGLERRSLRGMAVSRPRVRSHRLDEFPSDRIHRLRAKADEVGFFRHAARSDSGVASWVSTQPRDVGGAACVDRFFVPGD